VVTHTYTGRNVLAFNSHMLPAVKIATDPPTDFAEHHSSMPPQMASHEELLRFHFAKLQNTLSTRTFYASLLLRLRSRQLQQRRERDMLCRFFAAKLVGLFRRQED